ncbi:MAG: gamma-glutamylcyclotransferase [Gammaproteobacteria bacterium]|nr:gamma-glutamylcyclotransferase [Gammaproteobacteria bacterium]
MSADDAASRLFVYGTLMMPAVLHAVCGRPLASGAATLADFARYRLRGRVYPAIIGERGASTAGLVCEGLDDALWQRLDAWESPLYQRQAVTIHDAMGHGRHAHTYVLAAAHHAEIERSAWSPEEFAQLHLPAYLARWTGATP